MSRAATASPYEVDRRTSSLPTPRFEDVSVLVSELLPGFDEQILRRSFRASTMTVVLGALRARQMFPRSSRFDTKALIDWEASTKATLLAPDAFDLIFDGGDLMPYAVLPVQLFGRPLQSVILEMQRRLGLAADGFGLLWIGAGGHVTPLHHDGPMVHGRWHLVVAGRKRFDFLPPRFPDVSRLAPWDLYRRFSPLYKSALPDAWFGDSAGGVRIELEPGQMVTWGRRWWHRVEVARPGVTIALSTRGLLGQEARRPRGVVHRIVMRAIGDVESTVEDRATSPVVLSTAEVRAMAVEP